MHMKPITLEWVSKAEEDWHVAQMSYRARKYPSYDAAVFHAQQGCLSFGTTPPILATFFYCALSGYQPLPPEINCNRGPAVGISENFDR